MAHRRVWTSPTSIFTLPWSHAAALVAVQLAPLLVTSLCLLVLRNVWLSILLLHYVCCLLLPCLYLVHMHPWPARQDGTADSFNHGKPVTACLLVAPGDSQTLFEEAQQQHHHHHPDSEVEVWPEVGDRRPSGIFCEDAAVESLQIMPWSAFRWAMSTSAVASCWRWTPDVSSLHAIFQSFLPSSHRWPTHLRLGAAFYFAWCVGGVFMYLTVRSALPNVSSRASDYNIDRVGPISVLSFLVYFSLVNPVFEECFWRGFLTVCVGSQQLSRVLASVSYCSYHMVVLLVFFSDDLLLVLLCSALIFVAGLLFSCLLDTFGLVVAICAHAAADSVIMFIFANMYFEFIP